MTARYESPLLSCCASEYMPRLFFSHFYITDNPDFVSYRDALTVFTFRAFGRFSELF